MKRAICLFFIMFLVTVTALAYTKNVITPIDGKYSVAYSAGKENAGNEYYLAVVRGIDSYTMGTESMVGIFRAVCGKNGTVYFADFVPQEICDSTLLIAGGDLEGPTPIGVIYAGGARGHISFRGKTPATVEAIVGDKVIETVTTDNDGDYYLENVSHGERYTLRVTKKNHLTFTVTRTVIAGEISFIDFNSASGDLDGSGKILLPDIKIMIAAINENDVRYDLNTDGTTDKKDLEILLNNFNGADRTENG